MAKIGRNVAKKMAASLREDVGSGDEDGDDIKAARQEAALREDALSSLLVSTFAGAELAQRLPLEQQQEEDVSAFRWFWSEFGVLWRAVSLHGAVCSTGIRGFQSQFCMSRVLRSVPPRILAWKRFCCFKPTFRHGVPSG